MKNTMKITTVCSICVALGVSACASPEKRTAIGAGTGVAGGAVIGGVVGGAKGAAIGAATGGAVGAAIGNYLDKQAQELAKVAETERTQDGIVVKLQNQLLFDTGKTELKPDAIDQLTKLGDILAKYPEDRIRVQGHTDDVGSNELNQNLSTKRADEVRDVLLERGVKPTQMLVMGVGEASPIAPNTTEDGRQKNRRVELRIDVPQKGQQPKKTG